VLTALLYSLFALDQTVATLAAQYGPWLYALLFLVIFAETGLVVFPVLPGDSILFIAGTLVAVGGLDVHLLVAVLIAAAVLGDSVNYAVGHRLGPRAFEKDRRWLKREYLYRTRRFYQKYGGVTIIIGRFVPVIRTFAPFLAGVAGMRYRHFLAYNVTGGVAWIALLVYAGYLFGNIPWVKHNLSLLVLAFVIVSLVPAARTWWRERRRLKRGERTKAGGE
jgi:membrane-associated protein